MSGRRLEAGFIHSLSTSKMLSTLHLSIHRKNLERKEKDYKSQKIFREAETTWLFYIPTGYSLMGREQFVYAQQNAYFA
jgi:hypothetical protein